MQGIMKKLLYVLPILVLGVISIVLKMPESASANLSSSYGIPVLEIKYFPLKSGSTIYLDSIETLENENQLVLLSQKRSDVQTMSSISLSKLEEGSKYIKDISNTAAIDYAIIRSEEFLKKVPRSTTFLPFADHFSISNDLKARTGKSFCDYVDQNGVREIWIWMYHTSAIVPIESNMAIGTLSQGVWNHGSYGDVSNSYQHNDLPVCQHSYTVYNYNYFRGAAEAMHNHGHQLEALF